MPRRVDMESALKLLVVDDEEEFLKTISKRLERRGHEFRVANNCTQAISTLVEWMPDAIILDVKLPGTDGLECLRLIKNRWPALPVIMLTGHASMRAGVEGMADGASDYCLKPVDFDYLIDKIKIAIEEAP